MHFGRPTPAGLSTALGLTTLREYFVCFNYYIANRYLKSWLGMPQGGSFLPVHSGLGMDVKTVSHLNKESRSLDIVRALIQRQHTDQTTFQAKVQREQKWTRKSAISVRPTEIAGTILSSTETAIGMLLLLNPR
jgi:hypothetical protein